MDGTHFDGVVVGSGFGGPVVAYRLAEAGLRLCLLERESISSRFIPSQPLERVMDPRREYRLPDGGRGKRRLRNATPPEWWAASRNPSPVAESAMPTRNHAPQPTSSAKFIADSSGVVIFVDLAISTPSWCPVELRVRCVDR
jgi:choline dehydrogenase-like flavoprotein